MDDQPVQVMSAADAARQLGVSPSGLRRLGTIYAEVHGELGRELHTDKRIWTGEVVERLGQARALVEAERYRSIKEALGALDKGVDIDLATDLATPCAGTYTRGARGATRGDKVVAAPVGEHRAARGTYRSFAASVGGT